MIWLAGQVHIFAGTFVAEQNQVFARETGAVAELRGWSAASFAFTNGLGFVGEVDVHAVVEDVKRTFPEAVVALGLAVANDAALDLVNLFEAALDHYR